jgi:hypothetical protein
MIFAALIKKLHEQGYSKEAMAPILQGYDLGYAQALCDTNKRATGYTLEKSEGVWCLMQGLKTVTVFQSYEQAVKTLEGV